MSSNGEKAQHRGEHHGRKFAASTGKSIQFPDWWAERGCSRAQSRCLRDLYGPPVFQWWPSQVGRAIWLPDDNVGVLPWPVRSLETPLPLLQGWGQIWKKILHFWTYSGWQINVNFTEQHKGLCFVLPYFIMVIICGVPLLYLEVKFGS